MPDMNLELLQPVLEKYAATGRTSLLPSLRAAQEIYGYIPEFAAEAIAKNLQVPLADVYGVITFYSHFHAKPVSEAIIHVCSDPVCAMAGSEGYFKLMRESMHNKGKDTITIERSPCLGLCDIAPSMLVQGEYQKQLRRSGWRDMVANTSRRHQTLVGGDVAVLTRNCGKGKTTWLADYKASGGYSGLAKALKLQPVEVIAEVKASGLVGRGGAAFPTGLKWEGAAKTAETTRYVVCNADEAEPGTFKDRVIMEDDPHRIIEGIIIAAYAIQAHKGYMYIRGEYTEPFEIIQQACEEALNHGILGNNILGSGFTFSLELRQGAGAYVCGEETALFESIEGKRGMPRVKPPFPTTHGLFGKPTVINNVETLSNIPEILREGAEKYTSRGTQKSTGTKLFCLSGDIERPGLYEVNFGVSISHLINDLAGGVRGGRVFQAALVGGAAGAFAIESDLNSKLSFEDMRDAGIPLGAGVITIFDETRDLRKVILRLAHFFAEESCGKCYPCQLGTQRQMEILERMMIDRSEPEDLQRLEEIGRTMTDASICGLGQTASMAVLSALHRWPEMLKAPLSVKGGS
jgi:NADH-quinone oxidoreductase subunit F